MIERGSWTVILCAALGAAAIVLAWLPAAWPNPLGAGRLDDAQVLGELGPAAQAVDAACRRGDDLAFAAVTTASYRRRLGERLQVVDGALDADTLRALAAESACAEWLTRPVLAARANGMRAAIAVLRPNGEGAQILTFVWDGRQFLFDGSRQAVGIDSAGPAERWLVQAADATRGR